jgi:hypothetical protein
MNDERQPSSGEDHQQLLPDESAQAPQRRRRLRGYLATGENLSQRPLHPPPAGPPDPGEAENRQDGPEAAGAEASRGGAA